MQTATPSQINAKFQQMGVLLMLDAPEGLQFGIDNISWQVGNKFKGCHIIAYSLKSQKFMFPIKKFIYFGPTHKDVKDENRIRIFKWSNKLQRFVALKGQQAQGYREGVKKYHFDSYLGPYPQQNIQFWALNTRYITKQVLDKLDPIQYYQDYNQQYSQNKNKNNQQQKINIDQQSDGEQAAIQKQIEDLDIEQKQEHNMKKENKQDQNIHQIKKNKDFGGNIYYSQIPRRLSQSLNQTTNINLDRTLILQKILNQSWSKNQFGILGQLQYSFVAFLIGQCLDSYNQWKQLLITFTTSETAFSTHKKLMLQFIVVFYQQIKQFPKDFFFDQLAKDNFLTICIKSLNIYVNEQIFNKKCLFRIQKLLQFIQQQFGYFLNQQDEESPIVVQENQSYF